MHELPLLTNIAVALAAALVGGALARRCRLPPLVGYLIAGVAIGPGTPGFVGDPHTIAQLAELGIALLMFGVGTHFSFRELWQVRRVAIPGAILQMVASTALAYVLARAWGWTPAASLLLGVAISVASTVVLIRALMDRGLLDTTPGHVALGWLVLEDIATVVLLVLLPAVLGTSADGQGGEGGVVPMLWALGKAAIFVAVMTIAGVRVVPWLLARVASFRSRELFVLAALTVALGIALASARFFGVSIALGAFVAGVVVRESRHGAQVSADLLPFRDAFSVLFFVSVGMMVDVGYVRDHLLEVLLLALLVIAGKAAIAAGLVLAISRSARTALVVGASLAQIGEFSFIVSAAGVSLGLLDVEQASLLPAVALVSITLNPLVFAAARRVDDALAARRADAAAERETAVRLDDHLVVVGNGRVGRHVVDVLGRTGLPLLVVDNDPRRLEALAASHVPTLPGDAASSEILEHAGLDRARALVVAISDPITAELVVGRARDIAPSVRIVARAQSLDEVRGLIRSGATDVVDPQIEGAIELVRRVLLLLDVPPTEVHRHTEGLRSRGTTAVATGRRVIEQLIRGTRDLELTWIPVPSGSGAAGASVAELDLRARSGASCVAIARAGEVIPNPDGGEVLRAGDELAVIGAGEQIARATRVVTSGPAHRTRRSPDAPPAPA